MAADDKNVSQLSHHHQALWRFTLTLPICRLQVPIPKHKPQQHSFAKHTACQEVFSPALTLIFSMTHILSVFKKSPA